MINYLLEDVETFKDITLLVSSCKDYVSLLDNFFIQFKKYFSDFDGDIIINTHYESSYYKSISNIYDDLSWSCRTKKALSLVKTPFVLVMMDDFFLTKKVDSHLFAIFRNILANNKRIGYLKLFEHNEHIRLLNKKYYNDYFFNEGKKVKFSISLQVGLWRKKYFDKVLRRGEDAWMFEINASYRSSYYKELKLTLDSDRFKVFDYFGGWLVKNGQLTSDIVDYYIKEEGLKFDNIIIHRKKVNLKKRNVLLKVYERIFLPLSIFIKLKYF